MTKVKICGLSRMCDIDFVNEAEPDFIGFIFAKSKRKVTAEQAKELRKKLNPKIQAVGVFVNEPLEQIISIMDAGIIDMVQLHGQESEDYIKTLKDKIHVPIIKAVQVNSREDIVEAQESAADYLLLDHGSGGTGHHFDWSLIGNLEKAFFLAGGLRCENVEEAIRTANPFAVDTSSGVESDGKKDQHKIEEFIRRVRDV
ncbi:phosphoribosylanthranilate isomerase [Clostridium aminobutyricum]|uniref:N-(5'-phosphoribosyl)anthranilate isomerase n=1 Tax=Clostridium aminobutyricum TaxID=33953 RepID=A0A939D884_CLOAM|nr:phosphoribosylanthranilate isomerase [Clostridium aminobutyricum]MBN7772882.1 phosphoribosylanthranilate isomerase [Clostridium aminobutyricum]